MAVKQCYGSIPINLQIPAVLKNPPHLNLIAVFLIGRMCPHALPLASPIYGGVTGVAHWGSYVTRG